MKYQIYIISILLSILLSSCSSIGASNGTVIGNINDTNLKKGYGYIATRLISNKNIKQFLYFENHGNTAVASFFSDVTRFTFSGTSVLKLEAVPAGNYYWSSYYLSGGRGTTLSKSESFKVLPGKINYVGDVEIILFNRRNRFKATVKNNSTMARQEIHKKTPELIKKYPFVISISKIGGR